MLTIIFWLLLVGGGFFLLHGVLIFGSGVIGAGFSIREYGLGWKSTPMDKTPRAMFRYLGSTLIASFGGFTMLMATLSCAFGALGLAMLKVIGQYGV